SGDIEATVAHPRLPGVDEAASTISETRLQGAANGTCPVVSGGVRVSELQHPHGALRQAVFLPVKLFKEGNECARLFEGGVGGLADLFGDFNDSSGLGTGCGGECRGARTPFLCGTRAGLPSRGRRTNRRPLLRLGREKK